MQQEHSQSPPLVAPAAESPPVHPPTSSFSQSFSSITVSSTSNSPSIYSPVAHSNNTADEISPPITRSGTPILETPRYFSNDVDEFPPLLPTPLPLFSEQQPAADSDSGPWITSVPSPSNLPSGFMPFSSDGSPWAQYETGVTDYARGSFNRNPRYMPPLLDSDDDSDIPLPFIPLPNFSGELPAGESEIPPIPQLPFTRRSTMVASDEDVAPQYPQSLGEQVAPGAISYTTSTAPDGRVIYHPFRAVPASYQTTSGIVSGIQWVPTEATLVLPDNAQPANAEFTASWNRGYSGRDGEGDLGEPVIPPTLPENFSRGNSTVFIQPPDTDEASVHSHGTPPAPLADTNGAVPLAQEPGFRRLDIPHGLSQPDDRIFTDAGSMPPRTAPTRKPPLQDTSVKSNTGVSAPKNPKGKVSARRYRHHVWKKKKISGAQNHTEIDVTVTDLADDHEQPGCRCMIQ